MSKYTTIARSIYTGILAALLLLPLVQMKVPIVTVAAIRGVQKPVSFPDVKINAIRSGDFQAKTEKWFARNFGFREVWIRLHNQVLYSVLRTTPLESTIEVGKDEELFEKNYLEYYMDLTNAHVDSLPEYADRLKRLHDMLKSSGISMVVSISPSKAAFAPGNIPGYYILSKRSASTGCRLLKTLLEKHGISYVDGPALLRMHRNDYGAPLMARCSSHWNSVGALYSAQRFIAVAESLTGTALVNPDIRSVTIDHLPASSDRELADLLNLFWTPDDFPVLHATFERNAQDKNCRRPRLLVEGGSFNWIWLDALFSSGCIESADFLYYYSKPYGRRYFHKAGCRQEKFEGCIDWDTTLRNTDIVVIEINESLMHMFPVEFVRDMTNHYTQGTMRYE